MSKTLSKFIADDLRTNPPALEDPLTLAALATRYQVSLTPVRQAVRELISLGFLTKSSTGRIHPGPSFAKGRVAERGTSEAGWVQAGWVRDWEAELRTDILQRSLLGDQEFLREEALSERLGIGRTVLRQALHQLAGQGFVEHVRRCGWRARELTLASVEDWLLVRERLELLALEQAWPRLDPAVLARLRDGNQGARLDNDLHRYLISCARSPLLETLFAQHGAYFTAIFDHAAPETRMEEAMAAQHRAILDALLERDLDRAAATLAAHIRAQRRIVEALLAQLREP